MGVFLIRNEVDDKVLIAAGLNLPGTINRHKIQLHHGIHPNKRLQQDWNEFGSNNFSFEIVDELAPRDEPGINYQEELDRLEDFWMERLQPYKREGYNERKLTRAERLHRIAARHQG